MTKPAEQLKLVIAEGPSRGEEFKLDRENIGIGKDPKNLIVIDAPGVSQFHARIIVKGNNASITDLGSLEGLKVNGRKADTAVLAPGMKLHIGKVRMRVESAGRQAGARAGKRPVKKTARRKARAVPVSPAVIIAVLAGLLAGLIVWNMHLFRTIASWGG